MIHTQKKSSQKFEYTQESRLVFMATAEEFKVSDDVQSRLVEKSNSSKPGRF